MPDEFGKFLSRPLRKGAMIRIVDGVPQDRLDFQYNPESMETELTNVWYRPEFPGRWLGNAAFMRSGDRKTKFDVLIYGRSKEGIVKSLAHYQSFSAPAAGFSQQTSERVSPGAIRFVFGASATMDVTLEKTVVNETMWNAKLNTMMARVSLEFVQVALGIDAEVEYWRRLRQRGGL